VVYFFEHFHQGLVRLAVSFHVGDSSATPNVKAKRCGSAGFT
jgi:hypothetical protein